MLSTVIALSSVPTELVKLLNRANTSVSIFSAIARPACAPRSAITSRCALSRSMSVTWKYVPISPSVIDTDVVFVSAAIMRCDVIAQGVITACKAVNLNVPLVVRMKGTNEELGKKMLAESGLPIISADTMAEAATRVVAAAK